MVLIAVGACAAVGAGRAHAESYCVLAPSCTGKSMDLKAALTAAAGTADDDTITIGPVLLSGSGFRYAPGANGGNVTIRGAGAAQTTLTGGGIDGTILEVDADASNHVAHVQDLGLEVPRTSGYTRGLSISRGVVERVLATSPGTSGFPIGIRFSNGTVVRNSTADVGLTGYAGFELLGDPAQPVSRVEDSTAIASFAVLVESGPGRVTRMHIRAAREGVEACNTEADVDDAVIQLTTKYAIALAVQGGPRCGGTPAYMKAKHVTIVGDGSVSSPGAAALQVFADPYAATLELSHSIISNVTRTITWRSTAPATAEIGTTDANLSAAAQDGTPGTLTTFPGNIIANPQFLDAASGDYRLLWSSPAVDAGPSEPLDLWESVVDVLNQPRIVDGNGDGSARRDMGAYEYQRRAPHAQASAAPASNGQLQAFTFTARGSDPNPGEALTYHWTFDDGTTADGQVVQHAFATVGTHAATVTATDPTRATASATASVTVTPRCIVPNVRGLRLTAAKRALQLASCAVGKVKRRFAKRSRVGRVLSQSAVVGANLPPGTRINLVVGKRRRHK